MAVEISLNCWILGLDKANRFSVDVPLSKTVDRLKKAIKKEKEPTLNHIAADQLEIWKVSDPRSILAVTNVCNDATRLQLRNPLRSGDIAKTLGKINPGKGIPNANQLDPVRKLSRYFLETPVEEMIHLVVQVPRSGEYQLYTLSCTTAAGGYARVACERHLFDSIGLWQAIRLTPNPGKISSQPLDTRSPLHQTQTLRQLYVKNFPDNAPSSQGVPSQFAKLQRNKRHTIRWDQPPPAASSIPSTLLHPIFGKFIDDCENYKPTAADNKLAWNLSTAMSGFFKDELAQASRFREILRESDIIASATVIEGTKYTTDGDIQLLGFRFAIIEVKNEISSGGPEPHAQGISYYIHSTKSSVAGRPGFRFPCIVITLFGTPQWHR